MLILPFVLLLLIGSLVLGNYLITRHHLAAAAHAAARACAVQPAGQVACANARGPAAIPDYVRSRCGGGVQPAARIIPGVPQGLEVTLTCAYNPVIGGNFMSGSGVLLSQLRAQSTMPIIR